MDLIGIEPMTSSMPWKRAPSCATGPQREEHPLFCWSMPNTSNTPHVATVVAPLSLGQRMFNSPRSAKLTVLTLLLSGSVTLSAAAQAAAPGTAPAPAPAPAQGSFAMASLRPALANVQAAIGSVNVGRWKASAATRTAVQQDIGSMQRDLNATLPGLVTSAEASGPGVLAPSFAVFRNLDALYDVLLRVSETAALAGSEADAGSLEDARAGLEDGRGKLGAWLLQSIGAQDAQVARLQAPAAQPATPAPAPSKIVVDDGPAAPKPHKKKPAPTPAPQ